MTSFGQVIPVRYFGASSPKMRFAPNFKRKASDNASPVAQKAVTSPKLLEAAAEISAVGGLEFASEDVQQVQLAEHESCLAIH